MLFVYIYRPNPLEPEPMSIDQFPLANVTNSRRADIALVLVADESKSLAKRKGASLGPQAMKSAFAKSEVFEREGKIIPICPMADNYLNKKILDIGFTSRDDLYSVIRKLVENRIVPVVIGGDHSITTIAIDAISSAIGKLGLIYFDAHPDFVSSKTDYYGSVIADSLDKLRKSNVIFVGTRAAELEEVENIKKSGFQVISPLHMIENGINKTAKKICSRNTFKKYVSIDLDCLDPAFAPGVSVPTPCGLTSTELTYLVKQVVRTGIVGMDIVELCPTYDVNDITSALAARLLSESAASIRPGFLG